MLVGYWSPEVRNAAGEVVRPSELRVRQEVVTGQDVTFSDMATVPAELQTWLTAHWDEAEPGEYGGVPVTIVKERRVVTEPAPVAELAELVEAVDLSRITDAPTRAVLRELVAAISASTQRER